MKYSFIACVFILMAAPVFAQEPVSPVEIDADEFVYLSAESRVVASGNVVASKDDLKLFCDRLEYDRARNIGYAQGNVVIVRSSDGVRLTGEALVYDFTAMKGQFTESRFVSSPFWGGGETVSREGDRHIRVQNGYITTCDHDHPHFRIRSPKVDVYAGDKAVARHATLRLGDFPIFYLPRYTQDLRHNKPMFTITPGYDKDWGSFVLTGWRHYWTDDVNTVLHVDHRSKRGWGEGLDVNYKNSAFGSGFAKIYYTQERFKDDAKFFFDLGSDEPVVERERYKAEWRNAWSIDERTQAMWQYHQVKDGEFLKDFFERDYDRDANPATYFLLTRGLDGAGTLSLRSDVRVNRFNSAVERLPEINYLLSGKEIFDSGFYFKNSTTYSNLAKVEARPSSVRDETNRVNVENEISYPFKLNIFELRPFVGGQHTYYSKTVSNEDNDTVRGVFKTGADVSTKFFRVYDVRTNFLNLDINRLRHVLTPSVGYFYTHHPSIPSSRLVQFDAVDDVTRRHGMTFGLENKLQTKRQDLSVDLLRVLVTSDYYLKEDANKSGFNNIISKTDLVLNQYVSFFADTFYDTIDRHWESVNFDVYFNDGHDRWAVSLGKRYDREVDDQITAQVNYRINPKWYLELYQRWDIDSGRDKEQQYSVVRDLHEWEGRITFNHKDTEGDAVWVIFTLKEFPDLGLNFGSSFNRRKAGAR